MASNYTEHYGLCQWEATDQVLREEFNQDNAKVEETLETQANILTKLSEKNLALETAISNVGNCRIRVHTRTGTGKYDYLNPCSYTFSESPILVLLLNTTFISFVHRNTEKATAREGYSNINVTWQGNTMSWWSAASAEDQFNVQGKVYTMIALYQTD